MKIIGILLSNVQTYEKDTFIPFSLSKNIIDGPNDAGKSIIAKALKVFSGVYTESDFAGLINNKSSNNTATICLYLENRTVLSAYLQSDALNRTNAKVVYDLRNIQMDKTFKVWYEYSDEITEYLGWTSIKDENICFNFVSGKINLFVNTSSTLNTKAIDTIGKNVAIENKISNIKTALDDIKELKRDLSAHKRVLETRIYGNEYNTQYMYNKINYIRHLLSLANSYNIIDRLYQCLYSNKYIVYYKYWYNEYCNNNTILVYIENTIKLCRLQKKYLCVKTLLSNIEMLNTYKFIYNYISNIMNLDILNKNILKVNTMLDTVKENIGLRDDLCVLSSNIDSIKSYKCTNQQLMICIRYYDSCIENNVNNVLLNESLKNIEYIKLVNALSVKLINVNNMLVNVNAFSNNKDVLYQYIKYIRDTKLIKTYMSSLDLLNQLLLIVKFILVVSKLSNVMVNLEDVNNQLSQFTVCPLCGHDLSERS